MVNIERVISREQLSLVAGVGAPLVLALALALFRQDLLNTDVALCLVLVVVAVSAFGRRSSGMVAALSAAVWFDFFFTRPYESFTINDSADVETGVLLLLVGAGVTEIAAWGRRQQEQASRQAGYVQGIYDAAASVDSGDSPNVVVDRVRAELLQTLLLKDCRFDFGKGVVGGPHPRLRQDGQIVWPGRPWDVDRDGLPVEEPTELLVGGAAGLWGRFLLTAGPESRPSLGARRVAIALADQVAAAFNATQDGQRPAVH